VILVAGEALIDLVAEGGAFRPYPGGGPFNTAVALARLEVPVAFFGRLSRDGFGRLLDRTLANSGVDRSYVLPSDAPTPLALVHPGADGEPEYGFYLAETAYAELAPADLPALGDDVLALHVGTLALATDPPGSALRLLVEREAGRLLVVVDPNVRPAVLDDAAPYRARLDSCLEHADVVKLSATDAAWLWPGVSPQAAAGLLLERGAALAVVTLAADGALARSRRAQACAASPRVRVADAVGAGDTFGAALLRSLWQRNALSAEALADLDDRELEDALAFAVAAAALQCTYVGAQPPGLEDVVALVRAGSTRA